MRRFCKRGTSLVQDDPCCKAGASTKFFESRKRKRPIKLFKLLVHKPGPLAVPCKANFFEGFDPGSERTLAAWIRHASRTRTGGNSGESGERGSNAWVTYPLDRDSQPNGWVIPGDVAMSHGVATKRSAAGGAAHVVLACWRGNGPPRLRCLAGVRARPAPLALRHWPDTYGWLQSRIFGNGRKPDRATPRVR